MESLAGVAEYAVLHGEASVAAGSVSSDVDVITGGDPRLVVREMANALARQEVYLAVAWNYDVGSWTTVWVRRGGQGGVQLDLVSDPEGAGRYGVRTDMILGTARRGVAYPEASQRAQNAYLLQKRVRKQDWEAVKRIRAENDLSEFQAFWSDRARFTDKSLSNATARGAMKGLALSRDMNAQQFGRKFDRLVRRTGVLVQDGSGSHSHEIDRLSLSAIRPALPAESWSVAKVLAALRRPVLLYCDSSKVGVTPDIVGSSVPSGELSVRVHDVLVSRLK